MTMFCSDADNINITIKVKNKFFGGFGFISIPTADLKKKTGNGPRPKSRWISIFFNSHEKWKNKIMHCIFVYPVTKQVESSV